MIRNIVFDMGRVLIRFDPQWFMDRAGITDPADRKLVLNELFHSVEWAMMDDGTMTEETAEPSILRRFPDRLHSRVHELLFHWHAGHEEIPGMEELVRRLKEAGYRLYLLSNASAAQHQYWPEYPVSRYFDGKLISCDVKVVKPSREIYRIFTERFSLKAEECLFIDDAPANIAAVVACGWNGVVFHGDAEELERRLREAGICIPGHIAQKEP